MYKILHGVGVVGGLAGWLICGAGPANADATKWCAVYSGTGGTNCGFYTIEQCRATVSGIGGFCQPNQFYTGPDKANSARASVNAVEKRHQTRRPSEDHRQRAAAEERKPRVTSDQKRRTPAADRAPEDRFQ